MIFTFIYHQDVDIWLSWNANWGRWKLPGWFPNTVSSVLDLLLDGAYHVIISPYILGEEKSSLIEYISRNGYMICFFISRQLLLIYWIYIRFYPEEFLVNFHILFHCLCYTISSEIISNVLLLYSLEPLQIRYFKIKITTSTYESKLSNRCRFTLPAFSSALFIYRKMINNPLSLVESCFIGWLIHVVSLLD